MSDSPATPLADLQSEALRLLEIAASNHITLRLFGGMAVHLRCPSTLKPGLARHYGDLDFITDWASLGSIDTFFHDAGYVPDRRLNTLYGDRRQLFFDEANHRQVDILVDEFEMCHVIPMAKRLKIDPQTLPLAELLLTKIQIVEMNEKDVLDTCAIFLDHDLGDCDGETINTGILQSLCADDWGLFTTVQDNLSMIIERVATQKTHLHACDLTMLCERLENLAAALQIYPKTARWKMRSIVGKRMIWYEEVEEVRR